MRITLLLVLVLGLALLNAVGRDEPDPTPEPEPVEVAPAPEPAPVVIPEPTPAPELVEVTQPEPRHEYSIVFNGINRYSDAPAVARINIGPQTAENHTVQLGAWFEIQVGENEWYSVMELVDLIR